MGVETILFASLGRVRRGDQGALAQTAGSIARPTNIGSKQGYRGINVVALWVEA